MSPIFAHELVNATPTYKPEILIGLLMEVHPERRTHPVLVLYDRPAGLPFAQIFDSMAQLHPQLLISHLGPHLCSHHRSEIVKQFQLNQCDVLVADADTYLQIKLEPTVPVRLSRIVSDARRSAWSSSTISLRRSMALPSGPRWPYRPFRSVEARRQSHWSNLRTLAWRSR